MSDSPISSAGASPKADAEEPEQDTTDLIRPQELPTLQSYQAVPSDAASYGLINWWDHRYMNMRAQFDWYHSYGVIRELIREYAQLADNIFIAGCGNSKLAEDMYYDGYNQLTNLDYSAVVIDLMREEYADLPELKWIRGDITLLGIPDETYDVVIDKALTDSLMCSAQPFNTFRRALNEIERILKPSGTYICISVGTPDQRLEHMENDDAESEHFMSWAVAVHAIPKAATGRFDMLDLNQLDAYYYAYVCKKRQRLWNRKLRKLGRPKRRPKRDLSGATGSQEADMTGDPKDDDTDEEDISYENSTSLSNS